MKKIGGEIARRKNEMDLGRGLVRGGQRWTKVRASSEGFMEAKQTG